MLIQANIQPDHFEISNGRQAGSLCRLLSFLESCYQTVPDSLWSDARFIDWPKSHVHTVFMCWV